MRKIRVIVNGLPGKMAWAVATAIVNSEDMELVPRGLTGPETKLKHIVVASTEIDLFGPDERDYLLISSTDIVVDFSLPAAINQNVDFYIKKKLPFVMGTTGGNFAYIKGEVLKEKSINAVVAPNMAKEVVALQAMLEFAATNFPGAFSALELKVVESHQRTKVDTSGTAKALVKCFNDLGVDFSADQIEKQRTTNNYEAMEIPREYWDGHGWHTYSLQKPDGTVFLEFKHNINGREPYICGTLDALRFLAKIQERQLSNGVTYTMIEVLKGKGHCYM